MSCQPSPQPQASGTAAATASSGTTTNSATRKRSRKELGSGSMSGSAPRAGLAGVPGVPVGVPGVPVGVPGGPVTRVPGDAVMGIPPRSARAPRAGVTLRAGKNYAYVTVTYESVGLARGRLRFHQEVAHATPLVCQAVSHRGIDSAVCLGDCRA